MKKSQHVLITGASRGLGLALAQRFAERGDRLSLVARSFVEGDALVADLERRGGQTLLLTADVGQAEAGVRLLGMAAARFGPVDVLIHNASTLGPVPLVSLLDTEAEELEATLAVNLLGPFRLSRLVAGSMVSRGEGTIAYVGSDAAVAPYANWGAYGASKAAGEHMHRIWQQELAPHGVRVVVVDPGEMNTQMHADAIPEADPAQLAAPEAVAARFMQKFVQDTPSDASDASDRWELSL